MFFLYDSEFIDIWALTEIQTNICCYFTLNTQNTFYLLYSEYPPVIIKTLGTSCRGNTVIRNISLGSTQLPPGNSKFALIIVDRGNRCSSKPRVDTGSPFSNATNGIQDNIFLTHFPNNDSNFSEDLTISS